MSEQYATASCLSCLLDSRKELEPYPEPFRLQQHMTFRVTLSTYTDYILSLPGNSGVKLLAQIDSLKALASLRSPRLYNFFLRDMAFALLKEISYAEEYDAHATIILPASDTGSVVSTSDMLSNYRQDIDQIGYQLRELLISYGYNIPRNISAINKDLFDLATIIFKLSTVKSVVKEIHFLYDTDG